jgi:CelD/BcsL family acetyltransferase involved in cellulose biosynthesis
MANTSGLQCVRLQAGQPLDGWDRFVEQSPQGSVFCLSWWLETMCRGQFELLVLRKGDQIEAAMPLPRGRKLLWSTITTPPLTQTLGPLLPPGEGKYVTQLSNEVSRLRALADALPAADFFRMNCHPSLTNWLPFHWAGFQQTTRYTYILDDLSDLDAVRASAAPQLRTKLRKAEKQGIRVEESDDIETLLELNRKTFANLEAPRPYTEDDVRRLDAACAEHNARRILIARDEAGQPHAAVCLVHDHRRMYNLVGGTDPDLRGSNGTQLMLWRGIELAGEMGLSFDFCGSMIEGVESFNRAFGGRLTPYFEIARCGSWTARLAAGARDAVARLRRRGR